jgi:hypothetical protein
VRRFCGMVVCGTVNGTVYFWQGVKRHDTV